MAPQERTPGSGTRVLIRLLGTGDVQQELVSIGQSLTTQTGSLSELFSRRL